MPYNGPRTLEEMLAAHKARQARIAAAALEPPPAPTPKPERVVYDWAAAWQAEHDAKEAAEKAREKAEQDKLALQALHTVKLPSLRKIIAAVSHESGVSVLDILSHRRTADIVLPRQIAMYLCKTTTHRSLPEIARMIGGRDHTTVLHGAQKIAARMTVDDAFKARVEALRATLEA